MVAYKVWNDIKHFIHKDTTSEMDVKWTTNKNDALNSNSLYRGKDLPPRVKAIKFFYEHLGFCENKRYDALKLM